MTERLPGFTLIELLLTLTIVSLLITLAVPAMRDLQQRQRMVSVANDLVSHINFARIHAVTTRESTIMCPSSNGLFCSGGNRWEQGWMVFRDPDRNGAPENQLDILRIGAGMRGLLIDSAGRTHIRYQVDGTAGGTNQTIKLCDRLNPDHARAVIISNPGRPRVDDLPARLRCPP